MAIISQDQTTPLTATPATTPQSRLPCVEYTESTAPLLRDYPSSRGEKVKAIDLIVSGASTNFFSPLHMLPVASNNKEIQLVANATDHLKGKLALKHQRPRAVHVCPDSEPFPAVLEIQKETARVIEVLAQHEIQSWLTTRGYIRPAVLDVLAENRKWIKIRIGLTTLDRTVQRALEPLAAPPQLRLKQIEKLRSLGIAVQVTLEPLVPALTDSRENLHVLLATLAEMGIRHVGAGYLALNVGTEEQLKKHLQQFGWESLVFDAFADGFIQRNDRRTLVRYLSRGRRQHGYALLKSLAADYDITVSISSISNPDFARPGLEKPIAQPRLPFPLFPMQSNI